MLFYSRGVDLGQVKVISVAGLTYIQGEPVAGGVAWREAWEVWRVCDATACPSSDHVVRRAVWRDAWHCGGVAAWVVLV